MSSEQQPHSHAIVLFNRGDFNEAFTEFEMLPLSQFTITMMIKCLYRTEKYHDAIVLFNLFPRVECQLLGLCAEMQYIRARC